MDLSAELPALQKKARADSGHSSADDEYYQWEAIPPPKDTDRCLASRFPPHAREGKEETSKIGTPSPYQPRRGDSRKREEVYPYLRAAQS